MKRIALAILFFVVSCSQAEQPVELPDLKIFQPLPAVQKSSDDLVTLGKMLYFDKRLSKNHDISCNSCHGLSTYGVDNKKTSEGHKKQLGSRNSPSVYNAALHIAQFWDGRAKDVEEQAKGPILNPVEMAMPSAEAVLKVINSIPEYVALFKKAFASDAEPVTYDNLGKAIGAFESTLITPSRFDLFLQGDKTKLSHNEQLGLKKFVETGCATCHNGSTVGGTMFMKLGLVKPWSDQKDLGRFEQTKNEADKMVFKVPSLRNIEKTAPYFHDGSVATLEEAIKLMGQHQLGKDLSDEDVKLITTWLKSLTAELPPIEEPKLPASGPETPQPDPN